jgi:nitrate/nitrite transport system ATP-binding protein
MAFLEIDGVCKGYRGDPREVLRDLHLSLDEGERVAIVGRSGAGKTTLLAMIAGLVRPCLGEVRLRGAAVRGPGTDRAVVFQNYSLLPWLTVHENVRLAIDRLHPDWSAARRRDHADRYVALVGLTAAREKRPAQLSGGMRQRVSVARALSMEPAIVLMDEPFGALDALTRATLQEEVLRIWRRDGSTALLVTNDVDEAIRLADRIVPLTGGPSATLGEPIRVAGPEHLLRAQVIAALRGRPPLPLPAEVEERAA